MENLRGQRQALRLSQWELSRLAHVSRFKLQAAENGARELTPDDEIRVCSALQREAERLATAASSLEGEKTKLAQLAADHGLELTGVSL